MTTVQQATHLAILAIAAARRIPYWRAALIYYEQTF